MRVPAGDPRTDEELVAAANAGDPAAFEAIYQRYRQWVLRVAYRFTHHRDDALDVLQDTFLYLLRKFPGFRLTARMTTFLYPVVRSIAVDRARKRGREMSAHTCHCEAPAKSDAPPEPAEDLAVVLSGLSDAQREVLLMRYVDDVTLEEIAAALSIPLGTVKSRLHGAIARLRAEPRVRRYFNE